MVHQRIATASRGTVIPSRERNTRPNEVEVRRSTGLAGLADVRWLLAACPLTQAAFLAALRPVTAACWSTAGDPVSLLIDLQQMIT